MKLFIEIALVLGLALVVQIPAAIILDVVGWSAPEAETGSEVWLWRATVFALAVALSALLMWSIKPLTK